MINIIFNHGSLVTKSRFVSRTIKKKSGPSPEREILPNCQYLVTRTNIKSAILDSHSREKERVSGRAFDAGSLKILCPAGGRFHGLPGTFKSSKLPKQQASKVDTGDSDFVSATGGATSAHRRTNFGPHANVSRSRVIEAWMADTD